MEPNDNKKIFLTMAALAATQTFVVLVLGAMVVFKSAEWIILGCLLLFSLISLAVTLSMGMTVLRIVESLRGQATKVHRIEDTLSKMLRGPRVDGLVDVADALADGSPEAVHRNMMRRFGA